MPKDDNIAASRGYDENDTDPSYVPTIRTALTHSDSLELNKSLQQTFQSKDADISVVGEECKDYDGQCLIKKQANFDAQALTLFNNNDGKKQDKDRKSAAASISCAMS